MINIMFYIDVPRPPNANLLSQNCDMYGTNNNINGTNFTATYVHIDSKCIYSDVWGQTF